MKCPQCQLEATPVGSFWVCGVHGPLPELKPFVPLRSVIHGGRERYLIVMDALDEAGEAPLYPWPCGGVATKGIKKQIPINSSLAHPVKIFAPVPNPHPKLLRHGAWSSNF